ncbi:MAG: hypothetical protein QNJ04_16300 [Desulfobacterales bacterium]|nr:hypothetical protein [Desulfobacterales bacterium]
MYLSDMELMSAYADDDSPKELGTRLKDIESWISAGLLTPKETHEARRVLRLLRERRNARARLH